MPHFPTPTYCRPEAFGLLVEQLPALETTQGLVRAAVAVSMHELDETNIEGVEAQIDAVVADVRRRLRSDDPRAALAHAHHVLFEEWHYTGNARDYYNPRNSYLPVVLESKRGLPITLALLYKAVLDPLGVHVHGIGAPGHFLVGVEGTDTSRQAEPMLIDPFFSGRVVTRDEAFTRIDELAGRRVARDPDLLRPTSHRDWILRLILNLIGVFDRLERREAMAAMLEMQAAVEAA